MTILLSRLRTSDVIEAAEVHERSFPSFFLSSLGQPFLRQFYAGFLDDPSAIATVARDECTDRLVGSAVGTTEPAGYFARLLRHRFVGFALAGAYAAIRRPVATPRLLKAIRYRGEAAGDILAGALLSSICVSPEAQGTGVGRELLAAWERGAAAAGATTAYLTTDADDNAGTNAFYIRNLWVLRSSYRTPEGRQMNIYTKELIQEI